MSSTKRIALVTGASRGIGKAIAFNLASSGYAVVINYIKSVAEANDVVAKIRGSGGDAIAIQADVSTKAGAESIIRETVKHYGAIDTVVHNAAIAKFGSFVTFSEADFDALNAFQKGAFFLFAETAKHIRDNGSVVYISSIVSHILNNNYQVAGYAAHKSAIETYARHLSRELAPKKVTVNSVSPGYTETDMLPPQLHELALKETPLKRIGTPEDIANVVGFITSDKGHWITGQNIVVDGGIFQLQ